MNYSQRPSADKAIRNIFWIIIFGIAMAFAESAVVAYLRAIYYPEGFTLPLKPVFDTLIIVEVFREIATILMLIAVAAIAGKKLWERLSYFLLCFAIWDIFYYIWLKVLLNWPSTLLDWDILFLIPLPWIAPVIAPVSVSVLMIVFSLKIIQLLHKGYEFKTALIPRLLTLAGTGIILFSFVRDTGATLHQQLPQPYMYGLLLMGELLYVLAFMISYLKSINPKNANDGRHI